MRERSMELTVGIFILLAAAAMLVLAFKVSGLTEHLTQTSYQVSAQFDNIGSLKVRAPVKVAGVRVGQVSQIRLDPVTYRAEVTISFLEDGAELPVDTAASIYTAGLLGANYIELTPGYEESVLQDGDKIQSTHPAVILEDLIGQFLFKFNQDSN